MSGETRTPEFLALNPNGKVPVVVDPQGPDGHSPTVFQSGAILQYLAEKTGHFWPASLAERPPVVPWLPFHMPAVRPLFAQPLHFRHPASTEHTPYPRTHSSPYLR